MKIMQMIPSLDIAGAEVMCATLSMELNALGNEVVIVSLFSHETRLSRKLMEENIRIYFLNKKAGFDISIKSKIRRIINFEKPDVLHTHLGVNKYVPFFLNNTKHIHTIHNIANKEAMGLDKLINTIFFKSKKTIPVALSKEIQNSIYSWYKIKYKETIPVIFNGIDLNECQKKEEYTLNAAPKLVTVARFSPQKNLLGLIDGFYRAYLNNNTLNLIIVGDGELREEIEKKIRLLELDNVVTLLGASDDVYSILSKADIFVLPSNYEGFPISIIEAMGTGLPIIASEVGGIPDMITDKYNGILCAPNAESICTSIEMFISDEHLRMSCGKNAMKIAQKNFSAVSMAQKYIDLYE